MAMALCTAASCVHELEDMHMMSQIRMCMHDLELEVEGVFMVVRVWCCQVSVCMSSRAWWSGRGARPVAACAYA